jgi:UDP-3-O-[3-hydroxymyristoyl] N-acetylglucosamine deacetylase
MPVLRFLPARWSRAALAAGSGLGRGLLMTGQRGRQSTLRRRATVSGVGVHSGRHVSITMHPADADSGINFVRTDVADSHEGEIPARFSHVNATELCTSVGVHGAAVATIEHLMAALSALDVDNVTVEIDGPEVPVMDGSAGAFIAAIDQAGVAGLDAPLRYLKVLKPVRIEVGESVAEFTPYNGRRIEVEIDFKSTLIGRQRFAANIDSGSFRRDIARARTFGFLADVEQMWAKGLARGASLENAVVIGDDRVINPEGLRFPDEFARHKALDAIGDLALAGAPILGCYRSYRGGHRLNFKALEALFADTDAWTMTEVPVRRDVRVEAAAGAVPALGVVAYGPDAS